jgi:WD40 repeat protein
VVSVAFSPDGHTLATGSDDKAVRLWDVGTRHQIGTLTGHTESVESMAFSPDGHILATGGDDGTARLWDVAMPDDLVGSVCAVAGRAMTRQEWGQYVPSTTEFRKVCP